tara:strand:+ start:109 stop:288 length:180 start_codon:yes stop_codon:yes gene_type:complete
MAWSETNTNISDGLINTITILFNAAGFNFLGTSENWSEESLASGTWTESSSEAEDWSEE